MAELHLSVTKRTLIKASDASMKPYTLAPSNFDTFPGPFPAWSHFIYPNPSGSVAGFSAVVAILKKTLPQLLNCYFPFAGRLNFNPNTGFKILCNNSGAELVEAEADLPLRDVDFSDVTKSLDKIFIPFPPELCLSVQLARYPCGGFSLVFASNHLMVDAHTLLSIARTWSEIARVGKPSWIPNHDRGMFKTRNPLTYTSSIEKLFRTITPDEMVNVLASHVFVRRLYTVEHSDLDSLRADAANSNGKLATRTEAFSAYIWKALARTVGDADPNCQMGWLVDGRSRLRRKFGNVVENYAGNLISLASGEAGVKEIVEGSLSDVAEKVSKSIADTANEEHFHDLNDWFEANKTSIRIARVQVGVGSPAVVISSCHNVRVDMDFGCGRPGIALPQISWGRLTSSFMLISRNPKDDGSWIVLAFVWPKLAEEFESDARKVLRPATAEMLGFLDRSTATTSVNVELLSRM